MLEARHLVKRFFGAAVVSDVSFDVRSGEVVGYLGPNGSGKSTTAKMLTGLLETSSGAVFWDGHNIALDPIGFHRRLGFVPEEPNLYTFQSAIEYLELVGRLRELPPALLTRKIGALLELFGLSEAANQDIGSYSKGMKQKVMIIAALLHDPDVLILDEPTAGVDVELRRGMWDYLTNLSKGGLTILLTTHYLEEAEQLAKHVAIINKGEIVEQGTMAHVLEKHGSDEAKKEGYRGGRLEEVFLKLTSEK